MGRKMTGRLQILLALALIIVFVLNLNQIRKRKLSLQYTLSWLSVLVLLFLVVLFPQILNWFTYLVGVALPINMIFFLGFVFTLHLVYKLTSAISKQADQICSLTQKLALLEKQREDIKHGKKD